ncbi:MAG: prolipoprotein diacylglyceryl transferase [Candidatus Doudnabacteria bacterium RIFCSPHIGHO2_02_FULL_48_21]|uniref:Phosphatidylglycerol--prolipoprotein diacylglyceryl transferase n=1 Tax=Candidatus Doudnabacteria bacterium RIFCSPLOWO2_02_FULL_48_13 TaxID=1817845 RepID=A0A1F5Q8J0_9BACT|nr:MAG: prolipoprotein diacylglyceryl transferase [Candidatus Doudnabacteria bacterium RIFCSPHIGHO2_01_48_18]OGE79883.1 MAG: prolipoprotein diacylglyceryl transferase [Candidatus Doudnabacteria bacterium RIFCSPHIGHO2_01_FULL_48_180]OGE91144.1 MAG: prolipoprotein diacylglyceryl transferase [Candidatus Doudnabacteria bacterium RIFCSPHIGHO2_12_FULL_47_25]OGE94051.1 MAG: prolipoprotein diacylglyceryl transferase [Candidatus Doudnabacteria bacterium RIFCSPHIGHO2_02_FULL_48_21]OGE98065.1 MAG: prolipo
MAIDSGFSIGTVSIHYYGLLLALAILAAFMVSAKLAPRFGVNPQHIESALPWLIFFGFLGARMYFVIFTWDHFFSRLGDILQIWKGGFSIYGGIIGAAIGMYIYLRRNNLPKGKFFDLAAVSLPLAQAIGRFGNFFNQEAFGYPTDLPWKLYISPAHRPKDYLTEKFYHPTFLYEALWNIAVFAIMLLLFRKRLPSMSGTGQLLGYYLVFYSIGRFLIESLRLDSFIINGARADQVIALLMCAIGLGIIYYAREKTTS